MSDGVTLSKELADEMIEHCTQGRPNEACGMLGSSDDHIVKVFRMSNAAGSPVRYRIDDHEVLAVDNEIRQRGWDLGGIFHSHTHTEAFPSPTDVREAREDVPYVIVSLASNPPVIKAYRIIKKSWTDKGGQIEEVPVDVVD